MPPARGRRDAVAPSRLLALLAAVLVAALLLGLLAGCDVGAQDRGEPAPLPEALPTPPRPPGSGGGEDLVVYLVSGTSLAPVRRAVPERRPQDAVDQLPAPRGPSSWRWPAPACRAAETRTTWRWRRTAPPRCPTSAGRTTSTTRTPACWTRPSTRTCRPTPARRSRCWPRSPQAGRSLVVAATPVDSFEAGVVVDELGLDVDAAELVEWDERTFLVAEVLQPAP